MATIEDVRTALLEAYQRLEELDGYVEGKFAEMRVGVEYPTWWDVVDGADPMEPDGLTIYSYALGPSRMHYFNRGPREEKPNYYTWYSPDPFATAVRVIREEWWPSEEESET